MGTSVRDEEGRVGTGILDHLIRQQGQLVPISRTGPFRQQGELLKIVLTLSSIYLPERRQPRELADFIHGTADHHPGGGVTGDRGLATIRRLHRRLRRRTREPESEHGVSR